MAEYTSELEYLSSLTILCVEDNKTTQMIYEALLEDVVASIVFADNGEDGYEKYFARGADIIISDYDMPILNGIDMITKIRNVDKIVPIILVTAIEDIEVIVDALKLGVNNFVKKPIVNAEIIKIIGSSAKILLANKFFMEKEKETLKNLEDREKYNSYQEDLGFKKEVNIVRNDFYYKMIASSDITLVDFMYKPLDTLSGDAYSARIIDKERTFYLVVDGMGKGLSASLTAMIMTSFINHTIDKMLDTKSFDISILIKESIDYIKPVLLEEEVLAIDYVLLDYKENVMHYAKFAMPVILMLGEDNKISRIKSNNPPLCKWSDTFNVSLLNIEEIKKFLIYSDGIVENETKTKNTTYADYIEADFLNAFTCKEMQELFLNKIDKQEDDITFIYINKLNKEKLSGRSKSFPSRLEEVDKANEWYSDLWDAFSSTNTVSYSGKIVFTELFMNAYEHGNLGIDAVRKNKLLDEDIYFETLLEEEKNCEKNITVRVDELKHQGSLYIVIQITDEGRGFDTDILSEIFKNTTTFNGRGVFVSKKNSLGVYYNDKGNHVLFLNKIESEAKLNP